MSAEQSVPHTGAPSAVTASPRGRGGARAGAAARRRERRQEIVEATRALFDQREMRDANIDDIARAVGINRAIIYRHFASKDELFALTLAEYLHDLGAVLAEVDDATQAPPQRMALLFGVFADFCLQYPAFLDCAFALLRQPGEYLLNEVSDQAMQRLGQYMASNLGYISTVLRAGSESGDFSVDDVDLTANAMYLQTLGSLHVARSGFVVRQAVETGAPEVKRVDVESIRALVVRAAVATARG